MGGAGGSGWCWGGSGRLSGCKSSHTRSTQLLGVQHTSALTPPAGDAEGGCFRLASASARSSMISLTWAVHFAITASVVALALMISRSSLEILSLACRNLFASFVCFCFHMRHSAHRFSAAAIDAAKLSSPPPLQLLVALLPRSDDVPRFSVSSCSASTCDARGCGCG